MILKKIDTKNIEMLKSEIESLGKLIARREVWLQNDINQQRSTWAAVNADTNKMKRELEQLHKELEEV